MGNAGGNRTNSPIIRVLFYHNPPDVFDNCHRFPNLKVSSMRCRFPGHCVELLMQVVNYLDLQVEPVIHHGHFLGGYATDQIGVNLLISKLNDGTPTGLLSMLANGSVDSICKLFTRTNNNNNAFDFSRIIYATWSGIAVRRHSGGQMYKWDMWSLFHPFTEGTWVAIGNFSYVVYGLLHVMLFCSLYQSWICTTLIGGERVLPFRSVEELVPLLESGRYKFAALPTNHWFFETVESSNDPRHIRIREAMRKYPLEIYEDESEVMELVQSGTHVAVVQGWSTLEWVANSFCDVVFVKGGMPEKAIHFAFSKGSPFVKLFDEQAIGHEAVFMHRKRWKYGYYLEKQRERFCLENDNERKRFKPLGLIPFLGPCVVLLAGNAFALIAFTMEKIARCYSRSRPKRFALTELFEMERRCREVE
uniref:Glucuronosyltransferase n=1 Tax=Globodera pallida TaxID=36090 RepID=A0A183C711_GLOPA